MKLDYEELLFHISDGVYFTDPDRRITYWNASAEQITGFSAREVVGRCCSDNILIHVDDQGHNLCRSLCPLAQSMRDNRVHETRVYLHHKEGHRIPVFTRVGPLHDDNGRIIGGAEFFTDISHQEILKERLQELERMALLDALTGLPNRHHLLPELSARFHEKGRSQLDFGVIFIDIDHFKKINDRFGHHTGDLVLKTVANTLKAYVRPFDLVGRWGGDEFLCIVRNMNEQGLKDMSERLRILLNNSFVPVDRKRINILASIGATIAGNQDTNETIIQRADALMYACKEKGGNQVIIG